MYQKFIIAEDHTLRFGNVYLHRDLLRIGEDTCYGGGLWKIDHTRSAIILYGRSFDFGCPDFNNVHRIDWSFIGGKPQQLLFAPYWPTKISSSLFMPGNHLARFNEARSAIHNS